MIKKIIKIIAILVFIGIILLLIIQIIPYGKDHNNAPVVSEPNWDSQQTRELAKRACFDCHSNETIWPWYSKIAPISWLVYRDVAEGRQRINFSECHTSNMNISGEFSEVINDGEMPPFQYLPMHPSARLSSVEKTQLINGLAKSLGR
jgi:hypothetical protein